MGLRTAIGKGITPSHVSRQHHNPIVPIFMCSDWATVTCNANLLTAGLASTRAVPITANIGHQQNAACSGIYFPVTREYVGGHPQRVATYG